MTTGHYTLTRLAWRGLRAHDRTLVLSDVNVFTGANGRGKSTAMAALHLLATGGVPGVDRTPDGVLTLARGRELHIEADVRLPDGKSATVRRSWVRGRNGKVTTTVDGTFFPREARTIPERTAYLTLHLGGFRDAWDASTFTSKGGSDLRRKLLTIVLGADGWSPRKWLPANTPRWALPVGNETADVWVRAALTETGRRLSAATARLDQLRKTEEDSEFRAAPDTEAIRAALRNCREDVAALDALASARHVLDTRAAQLTDVERRTGVSGERADIEALTQALNAANRDASNAMVALEALRASDRAFDAWSMRHVSAEAALDRARATLPPDVRVDDLSEHQDAATDAAAAEEEAGARMAAANRELETLARIRKILAARGLRCSQCGHNVLEDVAEEEETARLALTEATADRERAGAVRRRETKIVDAIASVVVLDQAFRELEGVRLWPVGAEDLTRAEAALASLQAREAECKERLESARAAASSAVAVERARGALDGARELYRAAEARAAGLDRAAVDAEVSRLEKELLVAGAATEVISTLAEVRTQIADEEAAIANLTAWRDAFQGVSRRLLDESKAELEAMLSKAMGAAVVIETENDRQRDDTRIRVDGVLVSSLSTGELWTWAVNVVALLGPQSGALYRPVIADNLEAVSADRRADALRAIVEHVHAGRVHQAFVAGCPDTVPRVAGVTLYNLDAA